MRLNTAVKNGSIKAIKKFVDWILKIIWILNENRNNRIEILKDILLENIVKNFIIIISWNYLSKLFVLHGISLFFMI